MEEVSQPKILRRGDPELGPVRFCRRCNEWWPEDHEFWVIEPRAGATEMTRGRPYVRRHDVWRCRACMSYPRHPRSVDTRRQRRELRKAVVGSRRPGWCAVCLAVKTTTRICHGCAGRIVGTLTPAKLAEWGLAGVVR